MIALDGGISVRRHGAEVVTVSLRSPARLGAPGEVVWGDATAAERRPVRALRPRSQAELAFLGLGAVAETFLRDAAAAGTLRLETELAAIVALEAVWGHAVLLAAVERATRFRRFKASDVRAILEAGPGVPMPAEPGQALTVATPAVPIRPLSAYALGALEVER